MYSLNKQNLTSESLEKREVKSPCGEASGNVFIELSLNGFLVSYQLFMNSDMKGKAWDFSIEQICQFLNDCLIKLQGGTEQNRFMAGACL